jgi:YD repeat-containing protein
MRTNVSRFSLVFTILFYLSIACLNLWLPLTLSALPPQTPGLPTPTPSPTLAPMPVIPDGPIAGVVPGAFEVTERGSAHYSITISAPPGVGGMEPRLALVYDNRGGNGLLGVGWSLQGLSAISRCGTTTVQDGFIDGVDFDGNDKFCLDGQRLNVISGSYGQNGAEYRTENDTFAKVVSEGVAGDSADSFRVWTKSGLRFEYGKTNDSKVEAQGKASVLTWQVNRISDTLGNYIDFSYTENTSTGELYPLRIQYTGNTNVGLAPVNSIEFQYEARTDAAFGYISGAIHQTTKRLKSIDLLYQGSLQQQYRLSYQSSARTNRSILAEVRQCDANNLCLAPTTFNWKANKQSFAPPTTLIDFPQDPHPGSYYAQHEHVGDVNGDGFSDYVWVPYNKSELWVALGKKTGLHPPQIWLPATIAPGIQPASWNGVHEALVDVNGDGLSDWVWIPNGPQDLWVALSNGNGFDTPTIWLAAYSVSGTHHPYSWEGRYEHFGDVNGDGRADYVWVPDGRYDLWVSLSTGTGFTPPQMWLAQNIVPGGLPFSYYGKHEALVDLNGDNLLDWIWVPWGPQDLWVALSHGTGFDAPQKWLNAGSAAGAHPFSWEGIYEHFGDVNGDGLTDYVWVPEHRNDLWVSLSTGAGLTAPALWLAQNPGNGYNPFSYYGQHQNLTDFNGDGRADWLYVPWGRNDLWLSYSKGDGFLPPEQLLPANGIGGFNPMSSGGIQQQLADLTGDGLSDWVLIPNGSSDLWMASPLDKDTDLLFQITNGHGSQIKVDYQPMTDPNLYTKQTPSAVYPNLEIAGPLFVVSAYEASNGVGGLNKFTYAYRGLRYSLDGRGFLGFESITKSEQSTGKYTVARYYQEYPYQTMLKSSSSYLPNGTLLYRVEHLPDVQLLNGGASHFPFNKESTESVYEADGALIKSINTKREFDTFGNLSKETVAFGSGHQKVLENTFDNDVSNWLIGRLRTTKTTDGSPTTSIETRNATFDYDSVTGLLVKEVTEPGHPTLKLIKEYQHDPFGNIIYSTTSGPSFATRNVQSVYDASGRFEIENYNELAHNTRKTYDPATGEMIELLDPAGRITTWQYDTFGRKLRETRADGTISRMRYYLGAGSGPAQTMYHTYTDASGQPPSIVYYDTTDREIRKEIIGFDGRKIFTDRQYDVLGQLIKLSEPYFQGDPIYWNENEYDLLGRVKKSTAANGGITTTNYAVTGTGIRRVTNLNPLNQKRVEEYDVHDRVIAIEDELGSRVTYAYEQGVLNGVTKLADSTGFILQSNVYDQRGNKVFISEANSGTVAYVYNGLGLLITQTDAKGSTVALEYDLLNRTIKRTEPEGVTNWTYDVTQNGIGRLGAVTAPDFSEQYAYDLFGRLTQTTSVIKGKSFIIGQSYDQYGRAAKVTYPTSFAIQNGYNALGFLEKIVRVGDGAILWRAKETTARGQVKQFELGNGLETALTFAPQTGLPTSMVTGTPVSGGGSLQGTVQNLVVDFDQIGNLRWRSDLIQNLTESFTYDGLNRVKDATILNGTSVHVDYLPNGNISFKSDVGSYTYGENNTGPHALTSISGAKSNTLYVRCQRKPTCKPL